ncbi:hypothetical protein T12_12826, partial [Trichinella patagoniensis]
MALTKEQLLVRCRTLLSGIWFVITDAIIHFYFCFAACAKIVLGLRRQHTTWQFAWHRSSSQSSVDQVFDQAELIFVDHVVIILIYQTPNLIQYHHWQATFLQRVSQLHRVKQTFLWTEQMEFASPALLFRLFIHHAPFAIFPISIKQWILQA